MTQYIILSMPDMIQLEKHQEVTVYINGAPYVLCSDECFEQTNKSYRKSPHIGHSDTDSGTCFSDNAAGGTTIK